MRLVCREMGGEEIVCCCLRVFCLRLLRYYGSVCPATDSSLMRATAGDVPSKVVDVYNGTTGAWSTAQLSVARFNLAAASVESVALFAGGQTSAITASALLCRESEGGRALFIVACVFCVCACCGFTVMFAL